MKWAIIFLILGIWFLKFNAEEFLVNTIPINLLSWIGIILIVVGAYRLGLKNFRLKNLKRFLK